MTDLTPNDLSHMSDEDFNALCPQGHHAPGAEPLSLAAQAVLDAIVEISPAPADEIAAVAFRAAAEHVRRASHGMTPFTEWDLGWRAGIRDTAQGLLAIADELEGQ